MMSESDFSGMFYLARSVNNFSHYISIFSYSSGNLIVEDFLLTYVETKFANNLIETLIIDFRDLAIE